MKNISIQNISKNFDNIKALNQVTFDIPCGCIFGLLGTNGAGKSTLLRVMSGILDADEGEILLDGSPYLGNPEKKSCFFYLPDGPYYFPMANMEEMALFYRRQYERMELESVRYMAEQMGLDIRRPIRTFSKGMKRQAFLILALCANTEYLLCDEVFDGLDVVVADVMKHLFATEMKERKLTVVLASHKLQDLEGFCHQIGILHKGGIMLAGDMRERAENICKLQCVFTGEMKAAEAQVREAAIDVQKGEELVSLCREGHVLVLLVRGEREKILERVERLNPLFLEEIPMTLEEIFVTEMEATGYDIRKILQ